MKVEFLAQPARQFGHTIQELLIALPSPRRITFVSAFASRQSLMRFRKAIADAKTQGADIRIVVGIDLDGTSENALEEILAWNVDARIVKNARPGHTFHPKICVFERPTRSDVLVGSNNWTEGGYYRNYECTAHFTYDRPVDDEAYRRAIGTLAPFVDPQGNTARQLDATFLRLLVDRGLVRPEREIQQARRRAEAVTSKRISQGPSPFGEEVIATPPHLSPDLLAELVPTVQRDRKRRQRRAHAGGKLVVRSSVELAPTAFFMHLSKLQGPNIPGEARIPLVGCH